MEPGDMKVSVEDMQNRAAHEVALPSRLGYTALLVGALGMAGLTGSLWATEPSLPARTQAAFAACVAIGLAWACFAGWVLAKKHVLFANQRVYAARMATAFSGLFLVGSIALRDHLGVGAIATSVVLFAMACASLVFAHQRFTRLVERRRALEGRT
jgi:hypothetical protein